MSFLWCLQNRYQCRGQIKQLQDTIAALSGTRPVFGSLPTVEQMLRTKDARAPSKTIAALFREQLNIRTTQNLVPPSERGISCQLVQIGKSNLIIRRAMFERFLAASKVDYYTHTPDFQCGDFSVAMWGKIQNSNWSQIRCGVSIEQGHAVNIVTFADDERLFRVEPQTDKITLLTRDRPNELPTLTLF